MTRAIILLLDSFGVGASLDAGKYGDEKANTFGHIAHYKNPLRIPTLSRLGLPYALLASCGERFSSLDYDCEITASYGYAVEQSVGKDTPSGHWELAGVPVTFEWRYFPNTSPCFPESFMTSLIQKAHLTGVLGNKHASGTHIIQELGEEHIKTNQPIIYTSADSVIQIAAHEKHFGLERLYEVCQMARTIADDYQVGRVIARPFIGEMGDFQRTANRRDYSTPPPDDTLLDYLEKQGREVIAIGKTADIFAHRGITKTVRGEHDLDLFEKTVRELDTAPDGSLIFTNFTDFDSKFGHRRDVAGYASHLEAFDSQLPLLFPKLQENDLVIITADHGCDPTFSGSDHTREHIPILAFGPNISAGFIGRRDTFADIGQTIARHLKIQPLKQGVAFL